MTSMSRSIREALRYGIRLWRIWELWDKLLHVSGCAGLLLLHSGLAEADVSEWALYVAAAFFLLVGGYTVNDAADFAQDRLSGKKAIEPAPLRIHSLASSIAAIALGMLLIVEATRGALPLAVATGTVFLGVEYSLPPIRFKERGIWGVVVGALTQRPALFLVWVAAIDAWNAYALALACWLFFGGVAGMLGHQVLDRVHDLTGRVRTFVFRKGLRPVHRLGAACGIATALTAFAPFALMPARQALLHAGVLVAMSSVYAVKGLKSLRRIRRADPLMPTTLPE